MSLNIKSSKAKKPSQESLSKDKGIQQTLTFEARDPGRIPSIARPISSRNQIKKNYNIIRNTPKKAVSVLGIAAPGTPTKGTSLLGMV